MSEQELRSKCAESLRKAIDKVAELKAFIGLDGFVDEILHVVDKRESAEKYRRIETIKGLADRIAAASGKSTNIEVVNQRTKLGGNGPIMAYALRSFGFNLTYLGALGYPKLHPVFEEFSKTANVHSIAEPGHTDALEFDDGKVMMGKHAHLKDVNWANIQARFGRDRFIGHFNSDDLIGFVNWTMLPYMSDLWESLLRELCPELTGARRTMFVDLADPEKRPNAEIKRALDLIVKFQNYFDVTLGLNEKEAYEVADVLGLEHGEYTPEGLSKLTLEIYKQLPLDTLVVHPVAYAIAVTDGELKMVEGPYCANPLISTGAGDHFNAGFCLGKAVGLDNELSLLTGVASSGYYVRTAKSPSIENLSELLANWPEK